MRLFLDEVGDLVIRNGDGGESQDQTFARYVPPATKGAWSHVAVVSNKGEVKVYINGVALRPAEGP